MFGGDECGGFDESPIERLNRQQRERNPNLTNVNNQWTDHGYELPQMPAPVQGPIAIRTAAHTSPSFPNLVVGERWLVKVGYELKLTLVEVIEVTAVAVQIYVGGEKSWYKKTDIEFVELRKGV